jgi:hypothetical protein
MERHQRQIMQVVRYDLGEFATLPVEQAVRKLIAAGIKGHCVDPKLHRVLTEQVPRTGRLENVEANIREGYTFFKAYLEAHRDQVRAVDLNLAAFVCVTSIEALTHTAVLHYSESFSDEAFEALVDEATRLIVRYLQ